MNQEYSVSQLIGQIKDSLESQFTVLSCHGEVSNLSSSPAGHYYFTLSDDSASISCALFKMDALRNPIIRTIKNGAQISIDGRIGVYDRRGTFQILAKKLRKLGEGSLLERFEKLKARLQKEGLFDVSKKRAIPLIPQRIALITGDKSAALADFLNVFDRRAISGEIIVMPAIVQGDKSAADLVNKVKLAKQLQVDLIVLSRGGGSMEDLWSFNDERLARVISTCSIPIISAVGHQVDYTICDFVSDLRVETPTAAAQKITEYQVELSDKMNRMKNSLKGIIRQRISDQSFFLSNLSPEKNLLRLDKSLQDKAYHLDQFSAQRMLEAIGLEKLEDSLNSSKDRIQSAQSIKLDLCTQSLAMAQARLNNLSPYNILTKGYSIARIDGKLVTSKKQMEKAKFSKLSLEFTDGELEVIKK